jgi:LysM repeat protein
MGRKVVFLVAMVVIAGLGVYLLCTAGRHAEARPGPAAAEASGDAPLAVTVYVVCRGDTLSSISQKYYGTKTNWKPILEANRDLIKTPKDLKPDMRLVIPPAVASVGKGPAGQPPQSVAALSATTAVPSDAGPGR